MRRALETIRTPKISETERGNQGELLARDPRYSRGVTALAKLAEMHPKLAAKLGVVDKQPVRVVSRRGEVTLPASVVKTIRPDTVFIPYHWAGRQSANRLTLRALDPVSKIPEFKVCAVRVEAAQTPATGERVS